MNEHYSNAVAETVYENLRRQGFDADLDEVKATMIANGLTGNFNDDVDQIYDLCIDDEAIVDEDDEDEDENENDAQSVTDRIEKTVAALKIGYNFVPGIGAGWCRNEEDLEKMRDFVRGALTSAAMNGSMPPMQ